MPTYTAEEFASGATNPFAGLTPAKGRSRSKGENPLPSFTSSSDVDVSGALPKDSNIQNLIKAAAEKYNVPLEMALAMAQQESGYNPSAVGTPTQWGTAKGMFQFLDSTAAGHGIDPLDPAQAAMAAMKDLGGQAKERGMDWAIAHHFAGPDEKQHGPKTAKYVAEVNKRAQDIRALLEKGATPQEAIEETLPDTTEKKTWTAEEFATGATFETPEAPKGPKSREKLLDEEGPLDAAARITKNTFEGLMERLQGAPQHETVDIPYDEVRKTFRDAGMPETASNPLEKMTMMQYGLPLEKVTMAAESAVDRKLRWMRKIQDDPTQVKNLPKDLVAELAPISSDVQGFVQSLEDPVTLLLSESLPANMVSILANEGPMARKKFDEARKVVMQQNIVDNPEDFPAIAVQSAQQAIDQRAAAQDPGLRQIWDALKQSAKEDPGKFGAMFVNALMADPYMVRAPMGMGIKVLKEGEAVAKVGKTLAQRASTIGNQIIDGSITTALTESGITAAQDYAAMGEINKQNLGITAVLAGAVGGLGPIFHAALGAKTRLANPEAAKTEGVYADALAAAAKADVEVESAVAAWVDPKSGIMSPTQQKINDTLGIRSKKDQQAFLNDYRKQVKDTFKNESDYADYLSAVAEERINRAETLAAERQQRAAVEDAKALQAVTEDAAYTQARAAQVEDWRANFDRALEARDAQKANEIAEAFDLRQADQKFLEKLDADDAMAAAFDGDTPAIKRALNKASRRDSALNMPKWQRGEVDNRLLARLAATGTLSAGAYAIAPEDEKLELGIAGGLAGLLLPAGGSVLSRFRQSGAFTVDGTIGALPLRRVRKGLTAEEEVAARAGEKEMIDGVRAGDQKAIKALYDEYFPALARHSDQTFIKGKEARLGTSGEDIAQEALIDAIKDIDSFKGDSEFSTWLYGIAKNKALNVLRSNRSRGGSNVEGLDAMTRTSDNDMAELGELPQKVEEVNPSTYDTPEAFAHLRDVEDSISHVFAKMPEDIKLAVILKELEGFKEAEIAEKLGVPIGTVKSRLNRGRAMVTEAISKGWGVKEKIDAPKNQRGSIDADSLIKNGKIAGGALAGMTFGAYIAGDKEDRALAMLGGAGVGALLAGHGRLPKDFLRNMYGAVSTTVLQRAPKVYKQLQTLERRVQENTHKDIVKGHEFFQGLKKLDKGSQDILARALMTGEPTVIDKVLRAVGDTKLYQEYKNIRKVLDETGQNLEGLNLIKRKKGVEYFPRMIKDKEGLFKAINKVDRSNVEAALHEANTNSIRKNGRTLNALEESEIVNRVLFTDKRAASPGWTKDRGIEEITPELQNYYYKPQESFNAYVRSAVSEIEKAQFFGKYARKDVEGKLEYINVDKSVGKMMADYISQGAISAEDARLVGDVLKSRFGKGEMSENALIRDAKNVGNIGLLGNFWSAITQAGDVGASLYINGFRPTIEAITRAVTGKKHVDMRSFGLEDHIAQEFANHRKSADYVNKVFRATLFSGMDRFGKNTALNGAVIKASRDLATESGIDKFRAKMEPIFGDETDKLIKDLQGKKFESELAKDYAWMELARIQPISRSEYPQFYLDHPNFRSYLWLQSWTMKQFDVVRRDAIGEIAKGNIVKGTANLFKLATLMGAANMSADAIKDWLLGKDIDLSVENFATNIFKTFAWSEYESRQLFGVSKEEAANRRELGDSGVRSQKAEPIKALASRVVPPFDIAEEFMRGDPKVRRYIPFIGPYLWQKYKEAEEFEKEVGIE